MFKYVLPFTFCCLIVFNFSQVGYAKETDNYTGRYKSLADSTDILNTEMNKRIAEVAEQANSDGIKCGDFRAMRVLFHEQNAGKLFIGSMESWAEDESKVAKRTQSPKGSIYEGVLENGLIFNRLKLASTIKVNGQLIGTDKLGHFIDQGFEFYTHFRQSGNKMSTALSGSLGSEKGYSGGDSTGTISYADSAANFHGVLFYHNLVEGSNPLLRCVSGKWIQSKKFDFSEYVDASWDEGINCNAISDPAKFAQLQKNIQNLEVNAKKFGKSERYQCPIDERSCGYLLNRYAQYRKYILSPKCVEVGQQVGTPSSQSSSGSAGGRSSGNKGANGSR